MKKITTFFLFLFSLSTVFSAYAQEGCFYTLTLMDSWGDGWNGSSLTVIINGEETSYTLDNINDDGLEAVIGLEVMGGDIIAFQYSPGAFESEVSYIIQDSYGTILFQDGPDPAIGEVYATTASCPACSPPLTATVTLENLRAFSIEAYWPASLNNGDYLLQTMQIGVPDSETYTTTQDTSIRLSGLLENTDYGLQVGAICENGDSTFLSDTLFFHTPWAVDLGIVGVTQPVSGCGLTYADTITVLIENFGGTPQSLIPFNFSVNEMPGGVNHPIDGVFTGVLGVDSIDRMDFDMHFDFTEPGEYEIKAWTEVEDDSVLANDTFTTTIYNFPIINQLPYYESFDNNNFTGWRADGQGFGESSLVLGEPAGTLLTNAASGPFAWATNLEGVYNSNELTYLEGPCFDFSNEFADPTFEFALFVNTESGYDGMWLEVSRDGGENWEKLGAQGEGVNWYNEEDFTFGDWWSDNFTDQWVTASHVLNNTATNDNVKIRFVFTSDGSVQREGIGLDNFFIHPALDTDISVYDASNFSEEICGSPDDMVTVSIFNHGSTDVFDFELNYQIDNGGIITEVVNDTVAPGESISYSFETFFDSEVLDEYVVTVWTSLMDDFEANNTTSFFARSSIIEAPFAENFESGVFPSTWQSSNTTLYFPGNHNNPTFNVGANIFGTFSNYSITSPTIGPIEEGMSLSFDYRYVYYFEGTEGVELTGGDSLILEIAPYCSDEYEVAMVIDSSNHVTSAEYSRASFDLTDYIGSGIRFRIRAIWGAGDYYLDLDNFGIVECPADLALSFDVLNESAAGAADGIVEVNAGSGTGPYTYLWDTGDTGNIVEGLAAGIYTVTVTDLYGCSQEAQVTVDIGVGTEEIENLTDFTISPNPVTNISYLSARFNESKEVQIRITNVMGQNMYQQTISSFLEGNIPLDMSNMPSGVYFVQMWVDGKVATKRVARQ